MANKAAAAGWTQAIDKWGTQADAAHTWHVQYKRLTTATDNNAESVGVTVSWYGNECVNPTTHHKDPTQQYVLMKTKGTGCCGFGANPLSEKADSRKEWDFLGDNKDLLTDAATTKNALTTLPKYQVSINTH